MFTIMTPQLTQMGYQFTILEASQTHTNMSASSNNIPQGNDISIGNMKQHAPTTQQIRSASQQFAPIS